MQFQRLFHPNTILEKTLNSLNFVFGLKMVKPAQNIRISSQRRHER